MPSVLVNFILRYRTWVLIAIIVSSIAASNGMSELKFAND